MRRPESTGARRHSGDQPRPDQCTSAAPDGEQSCSLEAGAGGGRIATAEVTLHLGHGDTEARRSGHNGKEKDFKVDLSHKVVRW